MQDKENILYERATELAERALNLDGEVLDVDNHNSVLVFQSPIKNPNGSINWPPGSYHYHRDIGGIAVYIWKRLKPTVKKAVLVHELTEIMSMFNNPEMGVEEAHEIGKRIEQRYVSTLPHQDQVSYNYLKRKLKN
jgi:hypothetical protein